MAKKATLPEHGPVVKYPSQEVTIGHRALNHLTVVKLEAVDASSSF